MSWIKSIDFSESVGKLKGIYERIKGADDYIDNILKVHGLRPHSLEGHMALYKNVLHHSGNVLPVSFLETLGVYVSHLNDCTYCVKHHYQGMRKQIGDDSRAQEVWDALMTGKPESVFSGKELAFIKYAKVLALSPQTLVAGDIESLRIEGADDGEILEVNQVVSYFCYANRTVLGLGVSTDGDILGLSPNDQSDEGSWGHS